MPQSLAKNLIHLIYSTKDRAPCLSPKIPDGLFAYKSGILKEWRSPTLLIGGVADHVHVLFCLSKDHALAKVIEELKKTDRPNGSRLRDLNFMASIGKRATVPSR